MYQVFFLGRDELSNLQKVIEESLSDWIKNYTFTSRVEVSIHSTAHQNIPFNSGSFYSNSNGTGCLVVDKSFKWDELVYSEQLPFCPRDASFNKVLQQIKDSFWSSIFKVASSSALPLFSKTIDAYINLRLFNPLVGTLDIFASHSFFASFLEKEPFSTIKPQLESRQIAIQKLKIPLRMTFSYGQIPFDDLLTLKPGKVLLSNNRVENTFSLELCGVAATKISMGQKNGNLAFIVKGR